MNRKVLITAFSILAVMLTGIAVLLYILFSDSAGGKKLFSGRQEGVICAIPSNAVAVAKFGSLRDLSTWVLSKQVPVKGPKGRKIPFEKTLADSVLSGAFPYLSKSVAAVSFHYANELIPLYVFDAGRSGDSDYDDEIAKLSSIASAAGYVHKDCDCSTILSVNPILRKRRILLVSPSVNIVNSSLRHLNDNVSIYDHDAFAQAASAVSADNCLYLDVTCAEQISKEVLDKKLRGHSRIISGFSDWAAFSMDFSETSARFSGTVVSDMDTDLVRVFSGLQESSSTVCEMLPSTTVWALSIPLDSVDDFSEAFDLYLDSRMKLSDARKLRKIIGKKTGTDPLQWFKSLKPEELAVAWFTSGGKLRSVNLIHSGKRLKDSDNMDHQFQGALAALFGDVFDRGNAEVAKCCNGWIIIGSEESVREYSPNRAMAYSLEQKLDDASLKDEIPSSAVLLSYFSVNDDATYKSSFKDEWKRSLGNAMENCDLMPVFLSLNSRRKAMPEVNISLFAANLQKTQAPIAQTDTVKVQIPQGPFVVKNSDTGRNNLFVQNKNLSLSLKEETGKGIWTVPFKKPLCGSVVNVDMYGNGRLQFLFASGSNIYIMDRKGRYVNPYPVDLGMEILLGPAVFRKDGAYELMVLHSDNRLVKYGLDGKKDPAWNDIKPSETIVSLPEKLVSGASSCWIVRTSRQTLIYPENGGEALSKFTGNAVLRSDAKVTDEGNGVVSAQSYDGKLRKIKI